MAVRLIKHLRLGQSARDRFITLEIGRQVSAWFYRPLFCGDDALKLKIMSARSVCCQHSRAEPEGQAEIGGESEGGSPRSGGFRSGMISILSSIPASVAALRPRNLGRSIRRKCGWPAVEFVEAYIYTDASGQRSIKNKRYRYFDCRRRQKLPAEPPCQRKGSRG